LEGGREKKQKKIDKNNSEKKYKKIYKKDDFEKKKAKTNGKKI
jgi:hypothetical protein